MHTHLEMKKKKNADSNSTINSIYYIDVYAFGTQVTLLDFFIYFRTFPGNDYVMRDVSYIEVMSENDICMCMGLSVYF